MKCQRSVLKFTLQTPIGEMIVTHCQNGLHGISQAEAISDRNFDPKPGCDVTIVDGSVPYEHAQICFEWLANYFTDPKGVHNAPRPKICIMNEHGGFAEKVCLTLAKNVQFGQTVSYKELAEMVGNPGAVRAVGTAMSHNPLQLLVPCHRVLPSAADKQSNPKVGNYGGGRKNRVKQWLLEHEGLEVVGDCVTKKAV